jgi:error-prone DNA polymerase
VVVFHEQVIEIISTLTGISLAEADEKRRLLGDRRGQQEVCDWFFPAAIAQGYRLEVITKVWDVLRAFASFGFCKAHAAAFALPTYQSAWLKTHYPAAFLSALLTHNPGMYPKRLILDEARQLGIPIASIDINISDQSYRVEGPSIRLSLSDIKGISEDEIRNIIQARPFKDITDFVRRSRASRPTCEALVMVGAFDSLYPKEFHRRDLLLHLSDAYRWNRSSIIPSSNQPQLFFDINPMPIKTGLPDLDSADRVRHEVEYLNMDISHHMIEFYADFLNHIGAVRSSDLLSQRSRSSVIVAGVKVSLQTPPVRSGKRVMFLTLDDGYGCSDITFFQDIQRSSAQTLRNSELLLVRGQTRRTGPRGISLRATQAWDLTEAYGKWRNLTICEQKASR